MKRRLSTALLVAFLGSISFTQAHGADNPDSPRWVMPAPAAGVGSLGVLFMEPTIYPGSVSNLVAFDSNAASNRTDWPQHVCQNAKSGPCAKYDQVTYRAYLPQCANVSSTDCIEGIWAVKDGERISGTMKNYMPAYVASGFAGDPTINLPEGKASSIWTIPGVKNTGGTELFAVSVVLDGALPFSKQAPFNLNNFNITIDPVSIINGGFKYPFVRDVGFVLDGCLYEGCNGPQNAVCAAIDNGLCAARENIIGDVRLGISIRFNNPPVGWVHGRIDKPEFTIDNKVPSGKASTWSIEGAPMRIPVMAGWISNESAKVKFPNRTFPNMAQTSWSGTLNSGDNALKQAEDWLPILGEKASVTQSRWSVRSMENGMVIARNDAQAAALANAKAAGAKIDGIPHPCEENIDVVGQVSTNSMVYQGDPPNWDRATQSLDYKVTSPHFLPDGSVFKGTYDLTINKAYAKCYYNLDQMPMSATLTIVNDSGENQVGTTVVSTDEKWIHLSASGFTFSNPTLKVKFVTEPPKVAEVPKAPSMNAAPKVQSRKITCIKGKLKKVVSGLKPACPSGFKRSK